MSGSRCEPQISIVNATDEIVVTTPLVCRMASARCWESPGFLSGRCGQSVFPTCVLIASPKARPLKQLGFVFDGLDSCKTGTGEVATGKCATAPPSNWIVFRANRVGVRLLMWRTKLKRQPWEWIAAVWSGTQTNGTSSSICGAIRRRGTARCQLGQSGKGPRTVGG